MRPAAGGPPSSSSNALASQVSWKVSKVTSNPWIMNIHVQEKHISISIYIIYMCVCVNHLKRCKTSYLAGGRWGTLQSAANEDAAMFLWKRTCNFPVFRQWQPAKPRTGMSFFQQFSNYCTVFAIWLSCIRTSKSFEQGRRKISSHSFSLPIIKPFLSGLTEVFLHVRCIPHQ